MTETKRYDYLDITKGLGILAVVWAHIMLVGWSHKVIYAFHMPWDAVPARELFVFCSVCRKEGETIVSTLSGLFNRDLGDMGRIPMGET